MHFEEGCAGGPTPLDPALADPVDQALDQCQVALDHLVKLVEDGVLDTLDDPGLVRVMQQFETWRNRLPLVDHHVIAAAQARNLPETLCQGSLVRMLIAGLRLSPGEAARRVRAAKACGPRRAATGEALAPTRPVLAAAQRAGQVNPEQLAIIERALATVDHRGFDPADLDRGEQVLVDHAAAFGPTQLRVLAGRVVDHIDPDGSAPDDQLNADRRHLHLRQTRDGAWCGEFRLTGAAGAKLSALLEPLARPRTDTGQPDDHPGSGETTNEGTHSERTHSDGTDTGQQSAGRTSGAGAGGSRRAGWTVDPRNRGQRLHDALEEACDRLLAAGTVTGTGGVPATVVIRIDADQLITPTGPTGPTGHGTPCGPRTTTGHGTTSDGTLLSADAIRRIADQAEVYYATQNAHGVVLNLRRTRRLASRGQTVALYARDGGCSFPGCHQPPEHCQRHHIVDWADGGLTNLDNLTLLCPYHHHHFARHGWTCTLNPDRVPEWRPPRWIDTTQTPLVNTRITARTSTHSGPEPAPETDARMSRGTPEPSTRDPGPWDPAHETRDRGTQH